MLDRDQFSRRPLSPYVLPNVYKQACWEENQDHLLVLSYPCVFLGVLLHGAEWERSRLRYPRVYSS